MNYRSFAKTGWNVSEISLGTWVFGHGQAAWRETDDKESFKVMTKAVDEGINHIVTANYGNAEEVVGKGLKGMRNKVHLADSTGASCLSLDEMQEQLDGVLKDLQTDYLDFFYLHYPTEKWPQRIENMNAILEKGKAKHLGVSNFFLPQLKVALKITPIEFIQCGYNILWRGLDEEYLSFCYENSIAVTVYSPIARGFLTGKYKSYEDVVNSGNGALKMTPVCREDIFPRSLKVMKLVEEMAKKYNKTPAQVSLRWLLNQRSVTTVVVGARNISQLEQNLGAVGWQLEDDDWKLLNEKGEEVFRAMGKNHMGGGEIYQGLE